MSDAVVQQRKDVIIKVRRTERGVERQRVERILEEWTWDGETKSSPTQDSDVHMTNGHAVKSEVVQSFLKRGNREMRPLF